jgi:CheY-like chemotaxis protein
MSILDRIRPLAAELLELESTFGPDREPPNEKVAAKWLHLTSDFRAAHGLPRGYPGAHRRGILRIPTKANAKCRSGSAKIEAQCIAVGYGGLGLSMLRSDLGVGARLEVTEVEHQGKVYPIAIHGEVRWRQVVGSDVRLGIRFDGEGTWSRSVFSSWYWVVYHEYLHALASGAPVEPLIGEESARLGDGDGKLPRMLIVDDEPANIDILQRAFRGAFEIFTAPDGTTALELALRIKPHVVIADQRMPSASGVELLSNLRWQLPDTMRILVSGFADYETLVDAVNLAMVHHYAEKPIQIDNLIGAVKTLCQAMSPGRSRAATG